MDARRRALRTVGGTVAMALVLVRVLVLAGSAAAASPPLAPGGAKPFVLSTDADSPWIAVDGGGTGHVVWNQTSGSSTTPDVTHYCQLPRGTTACGLQRQFAPAGDSTTDFSGPKVALTGDGQVVVVTERCCGGPSEGVHDFHSTDGGQTFGPDTVIGHTAPSGDLEFGPGAFSVSAITTTETFGTYYQADPIDGPAPASQARLNDGVGASVAGAVYDGSVGFVDPTTPIAAFDDLSTIYWRRWGGSGDVNDVSTWQPAQTLGPGDDPKLASGPRGVFLMYRTDSSKGHRYVVARYDGTTFGPPTPISPFGDVIFRDFSEDASGNLHAVWVDDARDLVYAASADGKTWSKPVTLVRSTDPLANVYHPKIAAAPDGGGFVVWDHNDDHGGVDAIALPSLGSVAHPSTPGCPTALKVGVASLLAKAGCFKKGAGGVYTTGSPIGVNGLDVDLAKGATLHVDPGARSITSTGKATVKAGAVELGTQVLDWVVPVAKGPLHDSAGNPAVFDTGAAGVKLLGLPVSGYVSPVFKPGGVDLPVNLQVPSPVSGAVGGPESSDVTLHVSGAGGGLELSKGALHIHLDDANLGIAELKPFDITYVADPGVLDGTVGLLLPVIGSKIDSTFEFRNGDFVDATAGFTPPAPGIPLATSIFLTHIGFHAHKLTDCAHPTEIAGSLSLAGGPEVAGTSLVQIDGGASYSFPEGSCHLPGVFAITGDGKLVDIDVASVDLTYKTSGQVTFGASFHLGDPSVVGVEAGVNGGIDLPSKSFYAEGSAALSVDGFKPASVDLLMSSIGFGGCVTLFPFNPFHPGDSIAAGFTYAWGGGFTPYLTDCDTSSLKPSAFSSALRAGQPGTFTVPRGAPSFSVVVQGPGGPQATLTGPGGISVTSPDSAHSLVLAGGVKALRVGRLNETTFVLSHPAAGTYSVTPVAGQTVTGLLTGAGLPKPSVRARVVRGRGRARVLVWSARRIAGQVVRFVEVGPDTNRVLGVVRGSGGRLRFVPGDGRRGRRTIRALVFQDGRPRAFLNVARYVAPGPALPGRPPHVRVRRAGSSVVVTWGATHDVARWVVRTRLRDGRLLQILRPARIRRVVIHGVPGIDAGSILVAGLSPHGQPGPIGRASFLAHPKHRRRHPKPRRRVRRHR